MAATLKMSTFTITILALILASAVATATYFKQKIDFFYEHCKSAEEEVKISTLLTSVLTAITGWLSAWSAELAGWPSSRSSVDHTDLSTEGEGFGTSPVCQASVIQIFAYILFVNVSQDLKKLCAVLVDACSNFCSILLDASCGWFCAMNATMGQCFSLCADAFLSCLDLMRAGCSQLWTLWLNLCQDLNLLGENSNFTAAFVTVSVVFCLSVAILFCWKQILCRQNFKSQQMNADSVYYDSEYDDNVHNFSSYTLQNKRSQNQSSALSTSFGSNSPPYSRCSPRPGIVTKRGYWGRNGSGDNMQGLSSKRRTLNPGKLMLYVLLALLCVSIPWEFCRLYQVAVGNRAAVASEGVPAECSVESLSLLQTLKVWLSRQLAWSHDNPCERYFNAMFVDPVWDVTPFMVLMSVATRCIVHPTEMLAGGMGRALRNFFTQIPLHWQPVCMLLAVALTLIILLMTCSYRLHIPLLLRIEPRTPVLVGAGKGEVTRGCGRKGEGRRFEEPRDRQVQPLCCENMEFEFQGERSDESASPYELSRPKSVNFTQKYRGLTDIPSVTSPQENFSKTRRPTFDSRGQKENLDAPNPRGRSRVRKTLTSQLPSGVSARTPLRDVDVTSNRDVTSDSDEDWSPSVTRKKTSKVERRGKAGGGLGRKKAK